MGLHGPIEGGPMSMFPNELSIISPAEGANYAPYSDRLIEDSLYKPSGKDLTLLPDTTQPSTHHQNASPSLFGISLQKTSMMQGSKDQTVVPTLSDDPATTRTGGPSTNRQKDQNPHLNLNLNNLGAAAVHLGTARASIKNSPLPIHQNPNYSMRNPLNNGMDSTKTLTKQSKDQ